MKRFEQSTDGSGRRPGPLRFARPLAPTTWPEPAVGSRVPRLSSQASQAAVTKYGLIVTALLVATATVALAIAAQLPAVW